ncbi:MAG: hypothetical protein F4Z01_08405 [Gammaproteobacteria bacterium]|nr:hypothetical protein [Gammaproteobacteria bacterium]MYF38502.1 hypothetical protein [Gammaproteobacteria bacterium]
MLSSLNIDRSSSISEFDVTAPVEPTEASRVTMKTGPTLPPLDFPTDSVEAACGFNNFPPYYYREEDGGRPVNTPFNIDWEFRVYPKSAEASRSTNNTPIYPKRDWIPVKSEECLTALETHMNAINPYLWSANNENHIFSFVVLDESLTFERIFTDPTGDLIRVQDALSRPECLLKGDERNWELKETCHAEAFLNIALVNRFCYEPYWPDDTQFFAEPRDGVYRRSKTYYWEQDNPTPEQDRFLWKQIIEDDWVRMKCEELDKTLEFTPEKHPTFFALVESTADPTRKKIKNVRELLIELGARLGDDAAALTRKSHREFECSYNEEGYKYGRFSGLLTSNEWQQFALKKEPSTDYFLQTFKMIAFIDVQIPDPRDEFALDWEFVARHLCEPPYLKASAYGFTPVENVEHSSCKEIVHEIRQSDLRFRPLLDMLDKFEQMALELGVYE